MGKALYRQYRSTTFDEVIGQDHITAALKNSLKNGSVAHAYLLTGPRGVGKTSIARIFAYAVNGLPYKKDGSHLDIIEIDAASNRRIDEIRELRQRVQIAPTSAKYKVYIIDEVHMLTREAFNALLKTLEEPPDHVIFILATTEIHKLPDTIVSRCITFTFRPINDEKLAAHLKYIAKAEKLDISDDALQLLAQHGDGSFRDSISLLDQVKSIGNKISQSDIELALGVAPRDLIIKIMAAVAACDPKTLDNLLSRAYSHGASELNLSKQLAATIRQQLLDSKLQMHPRDATNLLKDLLDVPASPKPRARLELCLLNQIFKNMPQSRNLPEPEDRVSAPATESDVLVTVVPKSAPKTADKSPEATGTIQIDRELWDGILQKLKNQNNTLYSVARMAQPELLNNKLSLSFKFPFHFKQVNQPKNKSMLTLIMDELGHKDLQLEIVLSENQPAGPKTETVTRPETGDKAVANINNIFGKGEVLES